MMAQLSDEDFPGARREAIEPGSVNQSGPGRVNHAGPEGGNELGPETVARHTELPPWTLWEYRAGTGTPVVLLHGLSGSVEWWQRNAPALSKTHLVAAVDLVGFGRNRRFLSLTVPPGFDDLAELLGRWIEHSFEERVHLVGHSMGGQAAIHLAARRPDLIRSLTLVNSTGVPFAVDLFSHLRHIPHPPRALMSFSRLLALDFLRAGPLAVTIGFIRLFFNDARPAMQAIRIPTLLIWGDHDPLVPDRYARQIQEQIAGSRLVLLPRAGHIPMWAAADEFNAELLRFFEDVDNGALQAPDGGDFFSWGVAGCRGDLFYRRSGRDPRVALIHGLGMSSSYFEPLASAMHRQGIAAIAPDLAGFGLSTNAPPLSPREHAERLRVWAEELDLPPMVWVGHSTGCDVVSALADLAPGVVAGEVHCSPPWSRQPLVWLNLVTSFIRDIPLEPPALSGYVLRAYWRTGMLRWFGTLRRHVSGWCGVSRRPSSAVAIIGADDPLADRDLLGDLFAHLIIIGGAHAMIVSHPEDLAAALAPHFGRMIGSDAEMGARGGCEDAGREDDEIVVRYE